MTRSTVPGTLPPRHGALARFTRGDGPRSGPLTLDRSRIFVLPTRHGFWFAGLLAVMLLGALNYGNNLGMLFVFFLGSAGVVSILHTYLVLARLEFRPGRTAPVFAGGVAKYRLVIQNPGPDIRRTVEFRPAVGGAGAKVVDLPPGHREVELQRPEPHRGRVPLGRVTVASCHPLGLFRAWAHVEFAALECVVYPRPGASRSWLSSLPAQGGEILGGRGSDGDLAGLRPHVSGDPLRNVHWKASAKREQLVVKELGGSTPGEVWLTWDQLAGLGTEERLSRLCRGVLDAHAGGLAWGLRLPGVERVPGRGLAHRESCLAALAEYLA